MGYYIAERQQQSTGTGQVTYRTDKSKGTCDDKDNNKNMQQWPEDWKGSTCIPIFKKGDARSCDNYRTVALISHTSKILVKIIHKRMESTIEREFPDTQAGFRKARGTRDHIANMRWIMERQLE